MNFSQFRARESINLAIQLLRAQLWPLLLLFFINGFGLATLEDSLEGLPRTAENERILIQIAMMLFSLASGILLILVLSWGIPKIRNLASRSPLLLEDPFATSYLGSFFAEYFSVLSKVLLWGLLLILPGFYQYCRLIFVPYIVFFSAEYREGRVNALELSRTLTQGRFGLILLVILFSTAGELLDFLPQLNPMLHTLPIRMSIDALNFGISLWLYSFLYLQFEDALQRKNAECPS